MVFLGINFYEKQNTQEYISTFFKIKQQKRLETEKKTSLFVCAK